MPKTLIPYLTKLPLKLKCLLSASCLVIMFNCIAFQKESSHNKEKNSILTRALFGYRFNGLETFLKGSHYVGYFSDKDMSDRHAAAQLAQAQFILAPTIVDLNNTTHEFIIFDCTTDIKAMQEIQRIGALPYKRGSLGLILAKKPR